MELKYCEGCGGLLLRRAGDLVVYCSACQRKLSELPQPVPEQAAGESRVPPLQQRVPHRAPQAEGAKVACPVPKIPPQAITATQTHEPRRMA